jgi:hypothetical protein
VAMSCSFLSLLLLLPITKMDSVARLAWCEGKTCNKFPLHWIMRISTGNRRHPSHPRLTTCRWPFPEKVDIWLSFMKEFFMLLWASVP